MAAGTYANPALAPPAGGGDPSMWGQIGQDIGTGLNLAGNIYGLYQGAHLQGAAQDVFRQSDPFAQYRPGYGAELLKLMQDPSSITKQPGYQFILGQGIQAADRRAAGPGGTGYESGQESADLMTFGQGLASQFYKDQVATLASLAGSGISPANPYQALQGLGGAATGMGSSIAGLGGALGQTANLLSKLFPGGAGTPQAMSGIDAQSMQDWNTFNLAGTGGAAMPDSMMGDPTYQNALSMMQSPAGSVEVGQPGDYSAGGGGFDAGGMFANPRAAGGVAATSPGGLSAGQAFGTGGALMGIGLELAQGRPTGYAGAATGLAGLASRYPSVFGMSSTTARGLGGAAGAGSDILNIIQGIKTGGVTGYGQAGIGTAQLANLAGVTNIPYLGPAGAALSTYNAIKGYQSGATGQDILSGAATGAQWGSLVGPEGALVGALIGGTVGGVASAFGPGRMDPENVGWNQYAAAYDKNPTAVAGATPSQNFQALAGIFDARGSAIPFYGKFGRMGENQFTVSMTEQINSALKAGKVSLNASPEEIYSKVVQPWITQMGGSKGWKDTWTAKGASEKKAVGGLLTNLISQWQEGELTPHTSLGVSGQTIAGLPVYGG